MVNLAPFWLLFLVWVRLGAKGPPGIPWGLWGEPWGGPGITPNSGLTLYGDLRSKKAKYKLSLTILNMVPGPARAPPGGFNFKWARNLSILIHS